MTTEITKVEVETVTETMVVDYIKAFLPGKLEPEEQLQFIRIATAFQLNPLKREIYCIPYGKGEYRKLSIITGYETYLKRAERTGKLNGWDVIVEDKGEDAYAKLTIYRKDWAYPFVHVAYWSECKQTTYNREKKIYQLNAIWEKMGKFMLRKVAIAQGFRLCFPDELGGMPYTNDELPDYMTTDPKNVGTGEGVVVVKNTGDGTAQATTEQTKAVCQNNISPESESPEEPGPVSEPVPAEDPAPVEQQSDEPRILSEGEKIPPWFWKIPSTERGKWLAEGCSFKKVDGAWLCTK